jgi:formylglycine-generating enzyme
MRSFIISFFLIGFQSLAYAQDEGCYSPRRQKGIEAYDAKDYDKAIKRWQAVLENCTDIPNNHDINAWIAKAKAETLKTTSSVSTLPYEPDMVFVHGGSFQMGSDEGHSDEKPVHSVILSSFSIGKYEITLEQFKAFIDDVTYKTDADKLGWSNTHNGSSWDKKNGVNWRHDVGGNIRSQSEYNHPVIHVSWNDAVAYSQWLSRKTGKNYRLPTEAEWEFAARGGNNSNSSKYSGSNTIENVAWYGSNSGNNTHFIATKQANDLDIYDMNGNVWEWCSDWYDGSYYKKSLPQNPKGASSGSSRVLRGGSWSDRDTGCRVADRYDNEPVTRSYNLGFRVCRND